jgi:hypothetical protein
VIRARRECLVAALVVAGLAMAAPAQAEPRWPTGAKLVVGWKDGGLPGHALAEVSWPNALKGTGGPVERYELRMMRLYGSEPAKLVETKAGTVSLVADVPDRRLVEFQVTAYDDKGGTTLGHKVVMRSPDTTPPAVKWARVGGDGCDAPFALAVEAAEDDPGDPGGPTAVETSVDAGATWTAFTGPIAVASSVAPFASELLRVWVRDAAGNIAAIEETGLALDPDGPSGAPGSVRGGPGADGQSHVLAWDPVVATGAPVRYVVLDEADPSWKLETTATEVTLPALAPGITHRFVIAPVDACERPGTPSAPYGIRSDDVTPPSEPSVDASAEGAVVMLRWAPAGDDVQVDHYLVRRGDEQLGLVRGTSFDDSGAPDASVVRYAVVAVDSNGNSTVSAAVTLRTPDRTPPSMVPGITVSTLGSTAAIAWGTASDNVGVEAYEVRRDGGMATRIRARSFGETGVEPGEHLWEVRALDSAGNASRWSGVAGVTTPDAAAVAVAVTPGAKAGKATLRPLGVVVKGARRSASIAHLAAGGRIVLRFKPAVALPAGSNLIVKVAGGSGWLRLHRAQSKLATPGARLASVRVAKGSRTVSLRLTQGLAAGAQTLVLVAQGGSIDVRLRERPVLVASG